MSRAELERPPGACRPRSEYDSTEAWVKDNQEHLEEIATGDYRSAWVAKAALVAFTEDWE